MFSLSKKFILSCHCWINPISFLTGPINPVWIVIRIGRIIFDGINVSAYSASNFKIGCFIKKSIRLINFAVVQLFNTFSLQVLFMFLSSLFFFLQTS